MYAHIPMYCMCNTPHVHIYIFHFLYRFLIEVLCCRQTLENTHNTQINLNKQKLGEPYVYLKPCTVLQYPPRKLCCRQTLLYYHRIRWSHWWRCIVLQCVAVCYSVLQCVAVYLNVLQCIAVYCSVLQCIAVPQLRCMIADQMSCTIHHENGLNKQNQKRLLQCQKRNK